MLKLISDQHRFYVSSQYETKNVLKSIYTDRRRTRFLLWYLSMLYVNIQLNFYETICNKCRCDVPSGILPIKLLRFLNKPSESLPKKWVPLGLSLNAFCFGLLTKLLRLATTRWLRECPRMVQEISVTYIHKVLSIFNLYRPPTKLREGNVFTGLSTGKRAVGNIKCIIG